MTTRTKATSAMFDVLVTAFLLTLVGCGSNQVSIGEQKGDASVGGATGSVDAPVGGATLISSSLPEGGASPVGGSPGGGGVSGAGGASKAGGSTALSATGGASPGGGSSGGSSGTLTGGSGGSLAPRCGGYDGVACPSGYYCEYPVPGCEPLVSDGVGTCLVSPTTCVDQYAPVCGCDLKTYNNDCLRKAAGVGKSSDGACGGTGGSGGTGGKTASGGAGGSASGGTTGTSSSTGKLCSSNSTCGPGAFCEFPWGCGEGDHAGNCVSNDGNRGCIALRQPVCGCDGKTYGNDCERRNAGVSKRAEGECPKADGGTSDAAADPAALCLATGGQVKTQSCCSSVTDFPNSCLVGACGCAPESSHDITVCICTKGCFVPGTGCFSCTLGADQTCNNDPSISALHGTCAANGRCDCHEGYSGLDNGKCK